MKSIFFGLFVLFSHLVFSQNIDPEQIINLTKDKYKKVIDYQSDIEIKVNITKVNMPLKKARVYFKQPDKFKFDAKGFLMVPKRGMNFSMSDFFKTKYTAIYINNENIDGHKTHVIKVIPTESNSDIVLSTFWIDEEKYITRKIEVVTKRGTYSIGMSYNGQPFDLPSVMTIYIDGTIAPFDIATMKEIKKEKSDEKKETTKGSVTITYSNFKINTGIPDSFFDEKKKK